MSAAVLPFKPRTAETPHLHGMAICAACGYEWQAVIPVGGAVNSMECEGCGAMKGVYKRFVRYEAFPQWQCGQCQGQLFAAILIDSTPTVACASCGELHNATDLFSH